MKIYSGSSDAMQTKEIAPKTKWRIDHANSYFGFKVKHLLLSTVRGRFKEFDAIIYTTKEDFTTAEIHFSVNPASIDTAHEQRDVHFKGADLFDTENFKEIKFTAYRIEETDKADSYKLYGELIMKGIKKQIELDVEWGGFLRDPWGSDRALFKVKGKINRKDWGLNWRTALGIGDLLLSEGVWIDCEVHLTKQSLDRI